MTFTEMHVKLSVILAHRLGPEILTKLEMKEQVLHRVRLHLKIAGWLSALNKLLTRKLPMFLSRQLEENQNYYYSANTRKRSRVPSTNFHGRKLSEEKVLLI